VEEHYLDTVGVGSSILPAPTRHHQSSIVALELNEDVPQLTRLQTLRHSTAHVMAAAVKRLFPEAKLTIGPAIEHGFYYDFDVPRPFTDEDLAAIEGEMQTIVDADVAFEHIGLGAFKLLSVAGAKNPTLQRIYGTAFTTRKELDEHLHWIEDARRRDHRALGKELDLFSVVNEGEGEGGQLLWHPRGARLRYLAEQLWHEEHLEHGYELVGSPQLAPPSCPFHLTIYKRGPRSHRDLPVRFAELGSGHDAHLFMTRAQLPGELERALDFCLNVLRTFGFSDFKLRLATRPDTFVGAPASWDEAEATLLAALTRSGLPFEMDRGGAASGPRIELELRDAIGREWPCSTIQLDFDLAERFDLTYVGPDGTEQRAVMLHRALFGSLERFVAVLVEHHAGAFPLWLAPLQARVITVTAAQDAWAREVQQTLAGRRLRVDVDVSNEKLGAKVRHAQLEKIPLVLVCGDKEVATGAVAPRTREGKQMPAMPLAEFAQWMEHEAQIPRPTSASVRA
jgi:threonyl-tRNA synthetase